MMKMKNKLRAEIYKNIDSPKKIMEASGCWELRNGDGTRDGAKQRLIMPAMAIYRNEPKLSSC
jgi:hypothetical protein